MTRSTRIKIKRKTRRKRKKRRAKKRDLVTAGTNTRKADVVQAQITRMKTGGAINIAIMIVIEVSIVHIYVL